MNSQLPVILIMSWVSLLIRFRVTFCTGVLKSATSRLRCCAVVRVWFFRVMITRSRCWRMSGCPENPKAANSTIPAFLLSLRKSILVCFAGISAVCCAAAGLNGADTDTTDSLNGAEGCVRGMVCTGVRTGADVVSEDSLIRIQTSFPRTSVLYWPGLFRLRTKRARLLF